MPTSNDTISWLRSGRARQRNPAYSLPDFLVLEDDEQNVFPSLQKLSIRAWCTTIARGKRNCLLLLLRSGLPSRLILLIIREVPLSAEEELQREALKVKFTNHFNFWSESDSFQFIRGYCNQRHCSDPPKIDYTSRLWRRNKSTEPLTIRGWNTELIYL
jgi:hypothetical protein